MGNFYAGGHVFPVAVDPRIRIIMSVVPMLDTGIMPFELIQMWDCSELWDIVAKDQVERLKLGSTVLLHTQHIHMKRHQFGLHKLVCI